MEKFVKDITGVDIIKFIQKELQNIDNKILLACGCVLGSYVAYETCDSLSRAGRSRNEVIQLFHQNIRKIYNCGALMKMRDFYYDRNMTIINFGSYGVIPKPVFNYRISLLEETERSQDEWFRFKLRDRWYRSTDILAKAVGANPDNLVFVANVTDAVNCVLKSMKFNTGDAVLITSHTYAAVNNIATYYCEEHNLELLILNINFPIKNIQQIYDWYEDMLSKHTNIKLVLLDHISSSSGLLFPVKELTKICHKHNALVLIDGAHAPGQIQLNIDDLNCEFYAGNLHKWYYAPRGCGFLWIKPEFHDQIDPSLVSHNFRKGLKDRFSKQGTKDYTTFIAGAYAVSHYYPSIGGMEHLHWYIPPFVDWAIDLFKTTWNTEILEIPSSMRAPYLRLVKLPAVFTRYYTAMPNSDARAIQDMYNKYKAIMMITKIDNEMWLRVSAQIFSTKKEYYAVAKAVQQHAQELEQKLAA